MSGSLNRSVRIPAPNFVTLRARRRSDERRAILALVPASTDRRRQLLRDLLGAVGWAVFIGGGIAMGLALGSVGADVPADGGMLWYLGLIVAVGTLVVRVAMVAWKHRDLASGGATGAAAGRASGRADAGDAADLEPVGAPSRKRTTPSGAATTKRPAAKRPGASKPSGPKSGSSTRSSSSSTRKKPASGGTKPRPKPRKKPNG